MEYWQFIWKTAAVAGLSLLLYYLWRVIILTRLKKIARATSNDLDDRLVLLAQQFAGLFIFFTFVALAAKVNGLQISPILAGAGIVGVSLGFAAKNTLADLLAGIFLIADQPIRKGDRVKIDRVGKHWGGWGDVIDIGLRRTKIRNTDGVVVNYPNSLLANRVIINFSSERETPIRVRVRWQVDYDADIELMERVVVQAINSCPEVISDSPQVIIRNVDDAQGHLLTGIMVEARYHIGDIKGRTLIRSQVLKIVLAALRENNIPVATPLARYMSERSWQQQLSQDLTNG
ncbi:MAG: mechanosensitive ion channel domain-containing protein [Thermodesulfobacteriota bacterium]